jgi:hypothetical protein
VAVGALVLATGVAVGEDVGVAEPLTAGGWVAVAVCVPLVLSSLLQATPRATSPASAVSITYLMTLLASPLKSIPAPELLG